MARGPPAWMKRLFTNAGDAPFDSKPFFPVEFHDRRDSAALGKLAQAIA
jgi:hypothetical protein